MRRITENKPEALGSRNGTAVSISTGTFIIGGPGFQGIKGKVLFGTVD